MIIVFEPSERLVYRMRNTVYCIPYTVQKTTILPFVLLVQKIDGLAQEKQ